MITSESAVTPSRQVGLDGLIRHSSKLRVTMTEPGNSPSASRSALSRVSMTRAPSAIARAKSGLHAVKARPRAGKKLVDPHGLRLLVGGGDHVLWRLATSNTADDALAARHRSTGEQ